MSRAPDPKRVAALRAAMVKVALADAAAEEARRELRALVASADHDEVSAAARGHEPADAS